MITFKRHIGDIGEEAATQYLKKNGYRILERNYSLGHKEIDIIAESKTAISFVEVKTRTQNGAVQEKYGRPALAVNHDKQFNVACAARGYLTLHPTQKEMHLDIIEVYVSDGVPKIVLSVNHMINAYCPR